jgi:hypothetical protein
MSPVATTIASAGSLAGKEIGRLLVLVAAAVWGIPVALKSVAHAPHGFDPVSRRRPTTSGWSRSPSRSTEADQEGDGETKSDYARRGDGRERPVVLGASEITLSGG